jgi:hypothetical protein
LAHARQKAIAMTALDKVAEKYNVARAIVRRA